MENQTLAGTLVLVQPDMENDPDAKRGHIGVLTLTFSEKENYVKFPEGGESYFPAEQVMMLKDKQAVFNDLTNNGSSMPLDDFKAMYKIMLLQDRGTSQALYSALAIANDNPGIQERVLEPIIPTQKQELSKTYSR
ncbi:hypothetical protein DIU31_022935 [Mucilaginibacter rubeus]|uniref:Uncharacterized protein n=2 Tax=Mucilaginibacter rubeus TaxID=2027860 RepID=A0A364WQH1_9SPHI|nr:MULTISPECIES: hypothetical protein [Mucilaginibacter]QEM06234.1 hypothetical protein DIU31_022935 [Mucilaginibacter rubeus]QEM13751.1 hypothetical protein DEO27_028290 [Mucilaginibacter rubeus]QEM18817.1 hypothetical protein DIU38_023175 [Mucilaginibacter gossypii]QTE36188.1 hypothetical protein J3L18_24120 [Mucilaginibacter gossypii]QTE44641.1 hypothetical protein J3L19_04545 [Mucilaginibacter rubeus]